MTESKKDKESPQKGTSKKQIKATTGAWWKSTVEVVEETKPDKEVKEKKVSSTEKKKKTAQKKTVQKKPARKPASTPRKKKTPVFID